MADEPSRARGYRFGVFEVECAAAALRRDGTLVRLRGKPFDILTYLLERPGDLVSRDELRRHLWSADTFVDFDHGLNAAMNRLRDALGDTAENPRFVQTIPRKGYRFIAPVERVACAPVPAFTTQLPAPAPAASSPTETSPAAAAPVPPSAVRRRWAWTSAAVVLVALAAGATYLASRGTAVPVSGRSMLAVLPFENVSGTSDQDYFADGFTDELIAHLGGLNPDALGVIARTTVSRYRGRTETVDEIGRALHVQYVLEGSVRRSGPEVRITAQLIDVATQTQLWAETYDHDIRDVLLSQRDLAMRVADSLTMSVLRIATVQPMPSAEAYDATLRGRALRQQATLESLTHARQHFERAITLDSAYAPAFAGLADVFLVLGSPGWEFERPRDVVRQAREAARRAIELDPRLPDGYAVRGLARLWLDGDVRGAEDDLRKAVSLNGSYALAHQYLSTVLIVSGRADEAIASAQRALALDPLSPTSGTTLAYRLYYAGQFPAALDEFQRVLELAPDFASAWLGRAQTLRAVGRIREAQAALDGAEQRAGGRTYMRAYRAYALGVDGEAARARTIQAEITRLAATQYVSPFNFALMAAGLGDQAEVQRQVARLATDGSGWSVFAPLERELQLPGTRPSTTTAAAVSAAGSRESR
jgi:TolB-like protein/DNA-binding winged helix-turn-helix (wHTH) protein